VSFIIYQTGKATKGNLSAIFESTRNDFFKIFSTKKQRKERRNDKTIALAERNCHVWIFQIHVPRQHPSFEANCPEISDNPVRLLSSQLREFLK